MRLDENRRCSSRESCLRATTISLKATRRILGDRTVHRKNRSAGSNRVSSPALGAVSRRGLLIDTVCYTVCAIQYVAHGIARHAFGAHRQAASRVAPRIADDRGAGAAARGALWLHAAQGAG